VQLGTGKRFIRLKIDISIVNGTAKIGFLLPVN
jgi:hypothetical protein